MNTNCALPLHALATSLLTATAIWCAAPRTIPLQLTVWVRSSEDVDPKRPEVFADIQTMPESAGTDPLKPEVCIDSDSQRPYSSTSETTVDDEWVSGE